MARMRTDICTIILMAWVLSLATGFQPSAQGADLEQAGWTVMVYMAADSVPALPWEQDVNEMEAADLPDWLNVVVLVDPLGVGDSMLLEIAEDDAMDLVIVSEEVDDEGEVIPSTGEVDMASPDTLANFITYVATGYPADRLALVLWGHSGGWIGLCQDGTSLLELPDLGAALEAATDSIGRRIDLVVADCCFEGVLETMHEVKDHADWYVGSEIGVPAQGLRYDLALNALAGDSSIAPEDWGAAICEVHRMTLTLNSWSATMVTCDLREMDRLAEDMGRLASYMEGYADLYGGVLEQVLRDSADTGFIEWYLDAGDVLKRLSEADLPVEVRYLALQTLISYDGLVYEFEKYASPFDDDYDDIVNFTGVAVHAPDQQTLESGYKSISFHASGWGDATAAIWSDGDGSGSLPSPTVSYSDTDSDGADDEATLRWPSGHERLVAWVFAETESGLHFVDTLESTGAELLVSWPPGELHVSASAWDGGRAVSHHTMDIVLTRSFELSVTVVSGGETVADGIEVFVDTKLGPVQLHLSDGVFVGVLDVPGHSGYADLITVEVQGRNGATLGTNLTYVWGLDIAMEVAITDEPDPGPGARVILPLMFVVAAVFAVGLYLRGRGTRPPE